MNNLCPDIGYSSVNKHGEVLCGDNVEVVKQDRESTVVVLADGMGSGVKANILATLTSKIISTMVAAGMSIDECVETIAGSLPIDSRVGVAYCTFTIIRIVDNERADIIQYDNPKTILIRDGANYELPVTERIICDKRIAFSSVKLKENDIFIATSDGAINASDGPILNYDWTRDSIAEYMSTFSHVGFAAKTLTTILLDKIVDLYGGKPGDDTTVCTVRIRQRTPLNLVIGPPASRADCSKMMSLFFSKNGKHIVCGGTTASIAADFLGRKLKPHHDIIDPEVPPISEIEGVDLVTEGVLTISKVLSYAKDALAKNASFSEWGHKKDGASLIAKMLIEDATDINFFVGKAVNPAHQIAGNPMNFNIKMKLVNELSECLEKMGKNVKISYF